MTDDLDLSNDVALPVAEEAAPAEPALSHSDQVEASIHAAFEQHEKAGDVPRDEMGRFAARQREEAAKLAAEGQAIEQAAKPAVDGVAAPASWGNERAAMFKALPPEAQAYIAQREQQISDGFKRYEGLGSYAELAERNGGNLRGVLDAVKQLEDLFHADPVQGFSVMCQRAGFDPRQIASALIGSPEQAPTPQTQAIPPQVLSQLQTLQRELDTIKLQPVQREVDAFAKDPANKYFDVLSPMMAQLIEGNPGMSLKDAYDAAAWANPQIRAELLAAEKASVASTRNEALAKSAQAAQRASRGLSPSSSSAAVNGAPPRYKTVDEAIHAAFAAHS